MIVIWIIGIFCLVHAGHMASLITDDVGPMDYLHKIMIVALKNFVLFVLLCLIFTTMVISTSVHRDYSPRVRHDRTCSIENNIGELT